MQSMVDYRKNGSKWLIFDKIACKMCERLTPAGAPLRQTARRR
jgi:hypothetical protein